MILYLDRYEVFEDGTVYSLNGNRKLLKQHINEWGYSVVFLSKDKVRYKKLAHRLVAELYIANPENKLEVNHIDGNKLNNHVSNLEWVTGQENRNHACRTGLQAHGERIKTSKLTEYQVIEIRNKFKKGMTQTEISKEYSVSSQTISDIVNRKFWRHI